MSKNLTDYGLESILRQDGKFFKELVECVKRLKDNRDFTTKGIKESLIIQTIKRHLGMSIDLHCYPGMDAYMTPPPLKPTNAFDNLRSINHSGSTRNVGATYAVESSDGELNGSIDAKNSRVTGVFSTWTFVVVLGQDFLTKNIVTPEEFAAILTHELGHCYTYLQYFATIASGALLCCEAANKVLGTDHLSERKIILKKLTTVLNVDELPSVEEMVSNPKPGLEVLLLSHYYHTLKHKSGTFWYDIKNCEQLADTFVAKHGASEHLATGLKRIFSISGKLKNRNPAIAIITWITEFCVTLGTILPMVLGFFPEIYDRPEDRLNLMRKQLIEDLKLVNKSDVKGRQAILNELECLEAIIKDFKARTPLYMYIIDYVNPSGIYLKNLNAKQKRLEEMINNDLFYGAAKLRNLK